MKTINRLLILITIVLFASSCAKKHTIKLYVNTAEIQDTTVNKHSDFGQKDGSSNEDYTVEVKVGDEITWEGVSTSGKKDDKVNIISIEYVSGINVFDTKKLPDSLSTRKYPEKVVGKILYSTEFDGKENEYKYKITFEVIREGKNIGIFVIDPKLQVRKK